MAYYIYRKSKIEQGTDTAQSNFKIVEEIREPDEDEKFDFHKFVIDQMRKEECDVEGEEIKD